MVDSSFGQSEKHETGALKLSLPRSPRACFPPLDPREEAAYDELHEQEWQTYLSDLESLALDAINAAKLKEASKELSRAVDAAASVLQRASTVEVSREGGSPFRLRSTEDGLARFPAPLGTK